MTPRDDLHISSLVVHSTPARMQRVSEAIGDIEGACVHAASATGKVVVTLEAYSADEMLAKVSCIQHTDGVLSAALVYQCVEPLEEMNKVLSDDDDPT
jgi:nitrate reductase NapD